MRTPPSPATYTPGSMVTTAPAGSGSAFVFERRGASCTSSPQPWPSGWPKASPPPPAAISSRANAAASPPLIPPRPPAPAPRRPPHTRPHNLRFRSRRPPPAQTQPQPPPLPSPSPSPCRYRARARARVRQRGPRARGHDRRERVPLAAEPPQRALEQTRDLELRHPRAHEHERLTQRLAGERRRGPNRRHFPGVLRRAQPLHQLGGRLPPPRLPRAARPPEPLSVVDRERVRLVPERRDRPERGQLLEEPLPHAGTLHLDPRHPPGFRARLLVVAEVRHQQHVGARHHHQRSRPAEARQVADVGARGDEQPVQLLGRERAHERLLARAPPISAHGGAGASPRGPRVPAASSRRRNPPPRPPPRPRAANGAAPARARRCSRDSPLRTARARRAARPAPRGWYA